jgi:transposase InsO family protein
MTEVCEFFNVSRKTGHKWRTRFFAEGRIGLKDRSRAALSHPNETDASVKELLLSARRHHPTWGARKLLVYLSLRHRAVEFPAASTAHDLFHRHGLVKPRRRNRKTPVYDHPFIDCAEPNAVWSADFKGQFKVGDGAMCYPLTVTDNFSRYIICCRGLDSVKGSRTIPWFKRAFFEYGLPLAIRTDNGTPFASTGLGGLSRLSVWWIKLGIYPERIEPGHPEQNGRHERMHRTLKAQTARPPSSSIRSQQKSFDNFQAEFNNERPHEALGQRTPLSVYKTSTRSYPKKTPEIEYPSGFEVRRTCHSGEIKWRGSFVYVSQLLAGEPVGLHQVNNDRWAVYFGMVKLGELDERTGRIKRPASHVRRKNTK